MKKEFDFIAVGDIVTDAFIRIVQANTYNDPEDNLKKFCLLSGGKVPYESVTIVPAVGNSPNASATATKLGLNTALITNLGDDYYGKESLATLKKRGINTKFVKVHKNKKSNYHYILWYDSERTILVKHHDYSYKLPKMKNPKWIYFSSVGENAISYQKSVANYIQTHPETKLAFQPGTFQIKLGYEKLKYVYNATEAFFCNKEEAQIILQTKETNIDKLAKTMCKHGPKISAITDGQNGACVCNGTNTYFVPIYPDETPPIERTGAGDAFSSTFVCALALGLPLETAMKWAPIQSWSVIQHIGAQEGCLTRKEIEKHLAKAPKSYHPKKL